MSTNLITEHVEQPYNDGHGAVTLEHFWIAYPEHVRAYADTDDRISRAAGRGKLKRDAIASAAAGGAWIDTSARSTR